MAAADTSYGLFLLFALAAPTCLNVGMGMQKYGVESLGRLGRLLHDRVVAWQLTVWAAGTLLTVCSMAFGFLALRQGGNASTLGALGGFGLVVLALFSRLVLREELTRRIYLGLLVIMVGTSLMGYLSQETQRPAVDINFFGMGWFFAVFAVIWLVGLVAGVRLVSRRTAGVILGLLSGALGGVGMIFMKVITSLLFGLLTGEGLAEFFTSGYVYLCFGSSFLSFVGLQIALRYGQAVLVVSSFQSALVFSPTLIALFILGEPVRSLQWLALVVIVSGVALTTLSQRSA